MPDPISHCKCGTDYIASPPNIGKLLSVNEDKKAEEGDGEARARASVRARARVVAGHHLLEHLGMHGDIEGAGHVHGAGEDLTAVPEEVVDSLKNSPCAHVPRYAGLVGKLEIIEAEGVAEEDDDDPVDKLEDDTTNGYTAVILAAVETAKFVLDDGD